MSIQTQLAAALTSIGATHGMSATVVSAGVTATGVRDTRRVDSQLSDHGEVGLITRTVRLAASLLAEPVRGARITVDGVEAIVTGTRVDGAGAMLVIEYQETRPVTGTGGVS